MIDVNAQIECVQREIRMRRKVYPRWVAAGKMTQAKADHEIAAMEAVLKSLVPAAPDATPRTDAEEHMWSGNDAGFDWMTDHARQLERELAAKTAELSDTHNKLQGCEKGLRDAIEFQNKAEHRAEQATERATAAEADAKRYQWKRHQAWLRAQPAANWPEEAWKHAYDVQHDNEIEAATTEREGAHK